jgi:nucleotide-binding universal stress UspA family protein
MLAGSRRFSVGCMRDMTTLVVGYDGSEEARAALAYAAVRVHAGRLFIVAAADRAPDYLGGPYYQGFIDAADARAQTLLDDAAAQMPAGVDFSTELLDGPPADAIVAVAEARGADAIVVGSRGRGRVGALLGSVSHEVLHLSDRPVVVIPSEKEQS